MSVENVCSKCDAEYDTRIGHCPACGYKEPRRAQERGGSSLKRAGSVAKAAAAYHMIEKAKELLAETSELEFLKMEVENMALSLEAGGYGPKGKLCTPLGRYRAVYPKGKPLNDPAQRPSD